MANQRVKEEAIEIRMINHTVGHMEEQEINSIRAKHVETNQMAIKIQQPWTAKWEEAIVFAQTCDGARQLVIVIIISVKLTTTH